MDYSPVVVAARPAASNPTPEVVREVFRALRESLLEAPEDALDPAAQQSVAGLAGHQGKDGATSLLEVATALNFSSPAQGSVEQLPASQPLQTIVEEAGRSLSRSPSRQGLVASRHRRVGPPTTATLPLAPPPLPTADALAAQSPADGVGDAEHGPALLEELPAPQPQPAAAAKLVGAWGKKAPSALLAPSMTPEGVYHELFSHPVTLSAGSACSPASGAAWGGASTGSPPLLPGAVVRGQLFSPSPLAPTSQGSNDAGNSSARSKPGKQAAQPMHQAQPLTYAKLHGGKHTATARSNETAGTPPPRVLLPTQSQIIRGSGPPLLRQTSSQLSMEAEVEQELATTAKTRPAPAGAAASPANSLSPFTIERSGGASAGSVSSCGSTPAGETGTTARSRRRALAATQPAATPALPRVAKPRPNGKAAAAAKLKALKQNQVGLRNRDRQAEEEKHRTRQQSARTTRQAARQAPGPTAWTDENGRWVECGADRQLQGSCGGRGGHVVRQASSSEQRSCGVLGRPARVLPSGPSSIASDEVAASVESEAGGSCTAEESVSWGSFQSALDAVQELNGALSSLRLQTELSMAEAAITPEPATAQKPHGSRSRTRGSAARLRVCARMRPAPPPHFLRQAEQESSVLEAALGPHIDLRRVPFHQVWGLNTSTTQIAEDCRGLVAAVLDGHNAAAVLMGQHGSGKTHTLQGADHLDEPGLMVQLTRQLFERITKLQEAWDEVQAASGGGDAAPPAPAFAVHATAFEICEERLTDLLPPCSGPKGDEWRQQPTHEVFMDAGGRSWVSNLSALPLQAAGSFAAVQALLAQRRTAAAAGDHGAATCVVTLLVTSTALPGSRDGGSCAKLTFVEVGSSGTEGEGGSSTAGRVGLAALQRRLESAAGASRAPRPAVSATSSTPGSSRGSGGRVGSSQNSGGGLRIAANQGWAVAEVVAAAARPRSLPVPYRLCKLTRYLQDTLAPAGTAVVIVCLDPSEVQRPVSLSALSLAARMTGSIRSKNAASS